MSTDPESTTILLVLVHICLVCFTLQIFHFWCRQQNARKWKTRQTEHNFNIVPRVQISNSTSLQVDYFDCRLPMALDVFPEISTSIKLALGCRASALRSANIWLKSERSLIPNSTSHSRPQICNLIQPFFFLFHLKISPSTALARARFALCIDLFEWQ